MFGSRKEETKESVKILVISDTHGYSFDLERLLQSVRPLDAVIHCGDICGDEDYVRACAREIAGCPAYIVSGNNDFFTRLSKEEVFAAGGHKIYVTHGHRMEVYYSPEKIKKRARALGCDVACAGHTHVPLIDHSEGDMLYVNPGSLTQPRGGRKGSYAVISTDRRGNIDASIHFFV